MRNPSARGDDLTFQPCAPVISDHWRDWGGEGAAPPTRMAAALKLNQTRRLR
jgi:hypothetical protein